MGALQYSTTVIIQQPLFIAVIMIEQSTIVLSYLKQMYLFINIFVMQSKKVDIRLVEQPRLLVTIILAILFFPFLLCENSKFRV